MDDKSWDFYNNISYDVLQFCQILLGKPCSDQACLDHMKRDRMNRYVTYDGWLLSMKHLLGMSNDYLKQTELEDVILDGLMNIKKPFSNPEAIIFQRCLLYEKRCSEMKVRGKEDANPLFDFILKHALKKEIPEYNRDTLYPLFDFILKHALKKEIPEYNRDPLYPLFDCVSIWISLNDDLEDYRKDYMGGERVLLSEKTIAKLSKAKAAIQSYVNDEILSLEISDEAKEQIVGELFGSDAVANMPKKKDESEKAQKDLLRKLWDVFYDEKTPKPIIRSNNADNSLDFSVVAYDIWYDEFKPTKVNLSDFYRLLSETEGSNNWDPDSARKAIDQSLYKNIAGRPTLEEFKEEVNKQINNPKRSDDLKGNKKLLERIEKYLKLKDIYREKLKEKRDNNERKA